METKTQEKRKEKTKSAALTALGRADRERVCESFGKCHFAPMNKIKEEKL